MKKYFMIFLFVSSFIFRNELDAQIYSEAPITIVDGQIYTDMIYVKFKSHDVLSLPDGITQVNGQSISSAYPNITNIFSEFSSMRNLSLEDISFRKAIPGARPQDTVYVDVKTGERRKLPVLSRVFIVEFPKPVDVEALISQLENQLEVEYSHGPVQMVPCSDNSPNDPKYVDGTQWYLDSLKAPEAWDITKGDSDIKIAVIDPQGVPQKDHPDLVNKIVSGGDTQPERYHPTRVAGFAGAETDNGVGIASLGWHTSILTYESTNDDENRSILAGKIDDAVTAGADVINLSLRTVKGGFLECGPLPKASSSMRIYYYYNWDYALVGDAIESAIIQNVVVVASAGNTAEILPGDQYPCEDVPYPCYPAKYNGVIGVSGSYQNGNFRDDWNYGDFVDVNAPGATNESMGLYTTTTGSTYGYYSGTSFSAPMVAALAALIISVNNTLTPAEVQSIMENTADQTDSRYQSSPNDYMGHGRINAYEALKYTLENYGGTLSGEVVFSEDITINQGKTLTIEPGAIVKFASGKKLRIYGTLIAEGTEDDPIVFISANESRGPGDWYGIVFEDGSSGSVKYSKIKDAYYGIRCNGSTPQIYHNIISNNYYGIYIYNTGSSYATISHNEIQDNSVYGIYLYNSSPFIEYNEFNNNGYAGIRCYNHSSPSIHHNVITGTVSASPSYAAIACCYYSPAYISYYTTGPGCNLITGNNGNGIYGDYNCNIFAYWNSIYGNNGYEVKAYQPCTITARYNWWGSYPPNPDEFNATNGASIDYTHALSYDPLGGMAKNIASSGKGNPGTADDSNDFYFDDDLDLALQYQLEGKFEDAIIVYEEVIRKEIKTAKGRYALVRLEECYWRSNRNGFIEYLNEKIRPKLSRKDSLLTGMTLEMEAHWLTTEGKFQDALSNLMKIRKNFPKNSEMDKHAMFNMGVIYLNDLSDPSKTMEVFAEIAAKYPDDPLVLDSKALLGELDEDGLKKLRMQKPEEKEQTEYRSSIPEEFILLHNFPNPFNAITTIKYGLPKGTKVNLKVFDILGREVTTLVAQHQAAGYHQVSWNASAYSSGIYFYQIRCGKFQEIHKMFLLK